MYGKRVDRRSGLKANDHGLINTIWLGGARSIDRTMQVPRYQNTYRLSSFNPFDVEVVDKLVMETMESKLSPVTAYHPNHMAKLCLEIGSDLQNALCKKDYDR